jgi:hypothetical protein
MPDYLFIDISALAYDILTSQSKFNDTSSHLWTYRVSLTTRNTDMQGGRAGCLYTTSSVDVQGVFYHKQ